MNAREVLEALANGFAMRRKSWNEGDHIFIINNILSVTTYGFREAITLEELNASDWEIYRDTEKLKLGPEHVGRRVKHRNGDISIINGYKTGNKQWAIISSLHGALGISGRIDQTVDHSKDIVELLDKGVGE